MSATSRGLHITRMTKEGAFTAVIPSDPAVEAHRDEVLREEWRAEQADWDRLRAALPHRSEVRPTMTAAQERERQDRSLGREYRGYLHPMRRDVYLLALARRFEELLPRVDAMRAEMAARPEEYSEELMFDVTLFLGCEPEFEPEMVMAKRAEGSLAGFVLWVADPRSGAGRLASGAVLDGLPLWCRRSQWAFAAWSCSPHFPEGPG
jgi:hypothetical protein